MNDHSSSDSPPNSAPSQLNARKRLRSTKLDRTLAELENAFDSWNGENPAVRRQLVAEPGAPAPLKPSPEESAFKERTRALLSQLREQISDLSSESASTDAPSADSDDLSPADS